MHSIRSKPLMHMTTYIQSDWTLFPILRLYFSVHKIEDGRSKPMYFETLLDKTLIYLLWLFFSFRELERIYFEKSGFQPTLRSVDRQEHKNTLKRWVYFEINLRFWAHIACIVHECYSNAKIKVKTMAKNCNIESTCF